MPYKTKSGKWKWANIERDTKGDLAKTVYGVWKKNGSKGKFSDFWHGKHQTSESREMDPVMIPEISPDVGINEENLQWYDGPKPTKWYYLGNCVLDDDDYEEIGIFDDASDMAYFVSQCDLFKAEDISKLITPPTELVNKLEELKKTGKLNDPNEIVCGVNANREAGFIYIGSQDIHYFFELEIPLDEVQLNEHFGRGKYSRYFYCDECGKNMVTAPNDQYVMIDDNIWRRVCHLGEPKLTWDEDELCRDCIEKRLGRPLTIDDLGSYRDAPINDEFKNLLEKNHSRSVVESDNELHRFFKIKANGKEVGKYGLSFYNDIRAVGLGSLEIYPEYRNRGYGTKVIKQLVDKYKDRYDLIYCFVDADNKGAIKLYQKIGKVSPHVNDNGQHYVEFYKRRNGTMKINENTKITLTVGQIKRLLKEYELNQGFLFSTYNDKREDAIVWFKVTGPGSAELARDLPEECIEEIAGPGDVDVIVGKWVERLNFDKNLPIDVVKKYIRTTGVDDPEDMDELDMAEFVLWSLCCEIKEQRRDLEDNKEFYIRELGQDHYNDMMTHTAGNFGIEG